MYFLYSAIRRIAKNLRPNLGTGDGLLNIAVLQLAFIAGKKIHITNY
jgi:hypothetical protein